MSQYLLSEIVFLPLLGALIMALIPSAKLNLVRWVALITIGLQFLLSLVLAFSFKSTPEGSSMATSMQFLEVADWIKLDLGDEKYFLIQYLLGVDGISYPLVLLSTLLLLIGVISSWALTQQVKGYFMLYMLLSTSIVGCFVALDFFLFYLFFELMLLPMFFLIGIWGGPRRSYASIKFFIYTLVGSLFILIVMIGLYLSVIDPVRSGDQLVRTFNLLHMMDPANFIPGSLLAPGSGEILWGLPMRAIAFLLLMLGFAIKLPAVPFHTWLPDAHVEAPTAISVLLAGLLLKVGGYGFFRVAYSIFPDAAVDYAFVIAVFGLISILYGGLNALAQKDLKRLIAYSSVSHMGFVLIGLAALTTSGVAGSLFHMISHGLISGVLFLVVGVIYDRTQDRHIGNYSGLASKLPGYTFVVIVVFFASLGLPGLSGFVGEVMVLLGAFASTNVNQLLPQWVGALAVFGIIISAAYYLWTIQRMFFGKYWVRQEKWESTMLDLNIREWIMLGPLVLLIILLGVYPRLLLDPINGTINQFVDHVMSYGSLPNP